MAKNYYKLAWQAVAGLALAGFIGLLSLGAYTGFKAYAFLSVPIGQDDQGHTITRAAFIDNAIKQAAQAPAAPASAPSK